MNRLIKLEIYRFTHMKKVMLLLIAKNVIFICVISVKMLM